MDKFNKPQRSTEVRGQVHSISTMTTVLHEKQPFLLLCFDFLSVFSQENFFRFKMQFPHVEGKIAIDALECSNFSYFLLAHLPSSPSSPPLNRIPDLHILHLLDEFMKGTSVRAGEQTTHLDLIFILSSRLPDLLLLH